jgi:hypothetical protein
MERLASGRNLLLVVVVLLLMLFLCTIGEPLIGRQFRREAATENSQLPSMTGVPGSLSATSSSAPLAVRDRAQSDATCHFGHSDPPRPNASVVAAINNDPRAYLSKTAALRYSHREATAAALDPYQVSLNPSIYLVNDPALPTMDDGTPRVARDQTCETP